MKSFILSIATALLLLNGIVAQNTISNNYPATGKEVVKLCFQYGDIEVQAWDGNDVQIDGSFIVNGEVRDDLMTFKQKNQGGKLIIEAEANLDDVEHKRIIVKEDGKKIFLDGDNIKITSNNDSEDGTYYNGVDVDANFVIKVPRSKVLEVNSTYGGIEINNYFKNMIVHNTYGRVDAVLTDLPSSPSINILSTYSHVDVSIPSKTSADLSLKTGYGKVYSDIDFKPDYKKKGEGSDFGEDITAVLNSGSGNISLEATYSNIYLRKNKK